MIFTYRHPQAWELEESAAWGRGSVRVWIHGRSIADADTGKPAIFELNYSAGREECNRQRKQLARTITRLSGEPCKI